MAHPKERERHSPCLKAGKVAVNSTPQEANVSDRVLSQVITKVDGVLVVVSSTPQEANVTRRVLKHVFMVHEADGFVDAISDGGVCCCCCFRCWQLVIVLPPFSLLLRI